MSKVARHVNVDTQFYTYLRRVRALTGTNYRVQTKMLGCRLNRLPDDELRKLFQRRAPAHPRRSRRGQLETTIFPFYLLIIAVIAVIAVILFKQIGTQMTTGTLSTGLNTEVQESAGKGLLAMPRVVDFIVGLIALVILLASMWVGAQIPTHPMWAVLVVPFLILGTWFSVHISNLWDSITANTGSLATAATDLPVTNFLMTHLVEYSILVIVLSCIAFYGASRNASAGGGSFG